MGLNKGQMTDMQEWHHDRAKRKKKAKAAKGRWMTEEQIDREVQKRLREKVNGVLEDVKSLWVTALDDQNLFDPAKPKFGPVEHPVAKRGKR